MSGVLGGVIGSAFKTIFSVEYLVIAGGGPGGVAIGNYTNTGTGGGGAGGYLTATQPNFTLNQSYTITIGAGASSNGLEVGSNSTFSSITANGGGGGGSPSVPNGKYGGSGGGGGYHPFGTSDSDGAIAGQGFPGGSRNGEASGGGGGAGGIGGAASGSTFGASGPGLSSSITGTPVTRATGGRGNWSNGGVTALTGAANTGDGGWGGVNNRGSSGWGGSGVVILRYPNTIPDLVVGSGLVIDNGSDGNISGSGTRLSPSFTPSGFKVYRFKLGTGNVSW
jgi:hypothetical protein